MLSDSKTAEFYFILFFLAEGGWFCTETLKGLLVVVMSKLGTCGVKDKVDAPN